MREQGRFVRGHRASPSTEIRPGERRSPATEIQAGERRSPQTEFRKGQAAHNRLPVGSVRIRKRFGALRAFVKVSEPNTWLPRARVVWEQARGPMPRGHVIHHRDRDPLNDAIENLACLSRAEHRMEHHDEVQAWRAS
jgi:hypothetical protein